MLHCTAATSINSIEKCNFIEKYLLLSLGCLFWLFPGFVEAQNEQTKINSAGDRDDHTYPV